MQGTKVYMAGAEVSALAESLLNNGVKRILWSYFYIMEMKRERQLASYMEQNPDVSFFLDSGAFTYFTKWKKDASKLPHYEKYVERYFSYIDEYGHLYDRIAEPDLDNTVPGVTNRDVSHWLNEMLLTWPDLPVLPVWHGWRGQDEWNTYLLDDRIKFLGLGRQSGDSGLMRKLVVQARRVGKPVHGFAQTKVNTSLKKIPFDSVDSTSWLTGQQYGTMYVFQGNKFITLANANDGKRRRKLYRNYFKAIGCDYKKIEDDDVHEVRKANVLAWRMLGDRLAEIQKRRAETDVTHGLERPEGDSGGVVSLSRGESGEASQGVPRARERAVSAFSEGGILQNFRQRGDEVARMGERPRERERAPSISSAKQR